MGGFPTYVGRVKVGGSLPFVGIGEVTFLHTHKHPFICDEKGVQVDTCPWDNAKSTIISLAKEGNTFASLALHGKANTNYPGVIGKLFDIVVTESKHEHQIEISLNASINEVGEILGRENYVLKLMATPEIFSTIPLEIEYSFMTDGDLRDKRSVYVGERLLMEGKLANVSKGVINIPAGEVTSLGELITVVFKKSKKKEPYMVTRRIDMTIRMLEYGG
jgi:hypothetical protein